MKLVSGFLVSFVFGQAIFAQRDTISINGVKFITQRQVIKTEYDRKDTLMKLYRMENGGEKYLLKHYLYKYGTDAENEFESIGTVQINGDSLILMTHYLQKQFDPIPAWRKRIYRVSSSGLLFLLYDKSKYKNSSKWVKTDYFDE